MISIRRLLEQPTEAPAEDRELVEATLIVVANEALEAIEEFRRQCTEYFMEQGSHLQSMLSMMANTVAEISGQSEHAVARLRSIERRIEHASGLEDIRAWKNRPSASTKRSTSSPTPTS
jgi:hypothetical protein